MNLNKYLKNNAVNCKMIKENNDYPEEIESIFEGVYGYKEIKKELYMIRSWFLNKEILHNQKIMLPKGIVCYGLKGTGKSLLLKKYAESFNCPIYVLNGEDNINKELTDCFNKARKDEMAVIFIDEIDYLCNDHETKRLLQEEFDGYNKDGRILILCTTNDLSKVHDGLFRPGRIDRKFFFNNPDKDTRIELYKKFIKDLKLNDQNIDYDHISFISTRCSGADIRAIINDAYLRVGDNLTDEEIEESYNRISLEEYDKKDTMYRCKRVATHEIGHVLMLLKFNQDFKFYNVKFTSSGAFTAFRKTDENADSIKTRIENILIAFGGLVAEEIMFGYKDIGSFDDLNKIRSIATRFVERTAINNCANHVAPYENNDDRLDSNIHRRKNERMINTIMNKCYHKTKRYLRKHKSQIKELSEKLLDNGILSYQDLK